MNYALIGFGRMGRAIDDIARRKGHRRVAVVDPVAKLRGAARSLDRARLDDVDVAFEFTVPGTAREHVERLLERGVAVVCGTTGWSPDRALRETARRTGVGAVVAPNFSVGMYVFDRLVAEAARRFGAIGEHQPYVFEQHHAAKVDAPGGTALRLAEVVSRRDPRRPRPVSGVLDGALPEGAVHVAAVRAGYEPGRHVVGFDGPFDAVELSHRARSREGFASGAVLAAEWLVAGNRPGIHGFGAVVDRPGRSKESG